MYPRWNRVGKGVQTDWKWWDSGGDCGENATKRLQNHAEFFGPP